MEPTQNESLFGLSIDPISKNHLSSTASWAKFLAIMGFIACGLIVLMGIFAGSLFERYSSRSEGFDRDGMIGARGFGAVAAVFYILLAVLYFFPCLFLFNFASKMKSALLSNDQDILNTSFQNLKKTFRYVGVLTIIVIAFYIIILMLALVAGTTRY